MSSSSAGPPVGSDPFPADTDGASTKYKTITEGSATMVYPASEDSAVFYNPVQVQNRDLSSLMITLFIERFTKRQLLKQKKKDIKKEKQQQKQHIRGDQLEQLLQNYEQSLDMEQIIQQQQQSNNHHHHGVHILDALAASGLRSIRYWKEIPGIQHITINDLDPAAVERAHANLQRNGLEHLTTTQRQYGIRILHSDATHEMYMSRRTPPTNGAATAATTAAPSPASPPFPQYHVIDLDPYGSAAPFLDAAVQSVCDGGMLNITCTDMAALGGSHPETCYGRYAGLPIQRAPYLQEAALRILLHTVATTAAKYGRTVTPILSVGMNFYVRCFVEIRDSKAAVNQLSLQIGNLYQSTQCSSFLTIPHAQFGNSGKQIYQPTRIVPGACPETGAPWKIGGPMWLGELHSSSVVREALERLEGMEQNKNNDSSAPTAAPSLVLATHTRLRGLLTSVSEELNDVPLYHRIPDMCHTLSCTSPPLQSVKAALLNAGYRVSGYHKEPHAIKTDAPNEVLWDILRVWCQEHPPKQHDEHGDNKKLSKRQRKKLQRKQKQQQRNGSGGNEETHNSRNVNGDSTHDGDGGERAVQTGPQQHLTPGQTILAVKPKIEVDWTVPKSLKVLVKKGVPRFPMNPEKDWGPKKAASGKRKREESGGSEGVEKEEQ